MNSSEAVPKKLDASAAHGLDIEKKSYITNEPDFRFDFNEDQMAVEKLREGISKFAADAITLKDILKKKIEADKEKARKKLEEAKKRLPKIPHLNITKPGMPPRQQVKRAAAKPRADKEA